ncbi:hypothetical protein [Pseudomonas syringae]|nr:hypothetical protein [Pseudomonas syringae]
MIEVDLTGAIEGVVKADATEGDDDQQGEGEAQAYQRAALKLV